MNTVIRAAAAQYAYNKYKDSEFVWGDTDCLHLARTVLVKLGAKSLPKIPKYTTQNSAILRLKKQGFDSLEDLLLSVCIEIPPSMALPGDIGTVKGEGHLSAIIVSTGGKWLGWPADHPTFAVVKVAPERVFRYV